MTELNEYSDIHDAVPAAQPAAIPAGGSERRVGRKGPRALWFGVAGLTALVTAAAVGLPQLGWLAAQTTTTFWSARHPISAVEVDVSGGDLSVRPSAAADLTVLSQTLTWTVNKPQITETWQGDALLITEDCAAPTFTVANPCGANLILSVPANVSVQSTLDSGALSIRHMTGSVIAHVQSGDIDLEGDGGTVWARTDSGSLSGVGLTAQQVNAQTLSGDIGLGFAAAPMSVSASVSSGSVTVMVPRGAKYRLSGQTSSGDRRIAAGLEDDSSPRQITVDSDSGDVEVGYGGGN